MKLNLIPNYTKFRVFHGNTSVSALLRQNQSFFFEIDGLLSVGVFENISVNFIKF